MYRIHNIPLHAYDYKFIIFRIVDGDLWYWGADNDPNKAANIAALIGGGCCFTDSVIDA